MKNSKRISPVLVIIFVLLGLGIIRAGIHDAYYFHEYEDLAIAIPIGLLFGLPPILIYLSDKKSEYKSAKERVEAQEQGFMRAFFWFHVLVLIIMIVNYRNIIVEEVSRPILIVFLYMAIALGYSGYSLLKMRNGTYKHRDEFVIVNPKTKQIIRIDMYDENGKKKSEEEIKNEIHSLQNSGIEDDNPIK